MTDTRPLHDKYRVQRVDGTDWPGGKHHGCRYFVLDVDHDEHAKAALHAYAHACRKLRPNLADDLLRLIGLEPDNIIDPTDGGTRRIASLPDDPNADLETRVWLALGIQPDWVGRFDLDVEDLLESTVEFRWSHHVLPMVQQDWAYERDRSDGYRQQLLDAGIAPFDEGDEHEL